MKKGCINDLSRVIVLLAVFIPFFAIGQDVGIRFEKGMSWSAIKEKAKGEGKYIFMDCYATWCGPCKQMDRYIYPEKAVGDFFNEHFISIAVQVDKTPNDPQEVRDWYPDVSDIDSIYGIPAFPTYLFFTPDGIAVHRVIGARLNVNQFLQDAKDAFIPEKQYYTLTKNWHSHASDSIFLAAALKAAENADNEQLVSDIGHAYFASMRLTGISKDNIEAITPIIKRPSDKEFDFFLKNATELDMTMGDQDYVERILAPIIFKENVEPILQDAKMPANWANIARDICIRYPNQKEEDLLKRVESDFDFFILNEVNTAIFKIDAPPVHWNMIVSQVRQKYPGYNYESMIGSLKKRYYPVRINVEISNAIDSTKCPVPNWSKIAKSITRKYPVYFCYPILLWREANYYADRKLWYKANECLFSLFHNYSDRFGDILLDKTSANDLIYYYIFMHDGNNKALPEGIKYMKHFIDENSVNQIAGYYLDTYANLLYKMGKVDQAIIWENKAIGNIENKADLNVKEKQDLIDFKSCLEKMEKGDRTWAD